MPLESRNTIVLPDPVAFPTISFAAEGFFVTA